MVAIRETNAVVDEGQADINTDNVCHSAADNVTGEGSGSKDVKIIYLLRVVLTQKVTAQAVSLFSFSLHALINAYSVSSLISLSLKMKNVNTTSKLDISPVILH